MLELLVLAVCTAGSNGCDEALKSYFYEKPSLARKVKQIQNKIVFYVGDTIAYTVPPLYLVTQNKPVSFRIKRQYTIQRNNDSFSLVYVREF